VLFVPEGSIERVGIALLISGTFQVLQAYYQPYNSPHKNHMADAAGVALSLTYYLTLLVKAEPLAKDKDALGVLLIVLLVFVLGAGIAAVWAMRRQALAVLRKKQTRAAASEDGASSVEMGELPSSVIANPAYEVDDDAEEESGASERVAQLEAELAATKREHSKYTSARIAAELEKAHAAHAARTAELRAQMQAQVQAERERSAAEADELRAELAQLKKDE